MIYVLAYPEFDPKVSARIDRFRTVEEPDRARMVRPHVTLLFGVGSDHQARVASLLGQVGSVTSTFEIRFSSAKIEYDPYEKAFKLFLMCDVGRDRFIALHQHLNAGPRGDALDAAIPYEPHMTVATNTDKAHLQAVGTRDIGEFPIEAVVRELAMVEVSEGMLTPLAVARFD